MSNRTNMMVPSGWKGQDKRFAESIKETVDCLAGQRGDFLDKAVTIRDLLDSGLAFLPAGMGAYAGIFTDLTPPPADNFIPNLAVPPAPTNLTANGAFQNILLGWNLEQYAGHSGVEVYRHTSDSITDATMIGRASGSQKLFSDNVGGAASFYYWVRAFNQNGDYGAYNSSAGTLGTTQPDIGFLLGELTDQITSSQLATDLATSISLISADSDTAGSVAYQVAQESFARAAAILAESTARTLALTDEALARTTALSAEASARQAAITASATALQNQINDLLDTAPYDASVSYAVDDQVTYDGKLYKALQATVGNLPTDEAYWNLLGNYSSLGDLAGSNLASITAINTVSATSSSAAAQAIQGLKSTVDDATTGVSATSSALDAVQTLVNHADTGVTASAGKITALESTVNDTDTGITATSGALETLKTAVNDTDTGLSAVADKVTLLESTLDGDPDAEPAVVGVASGFETLKTTVNDSTSGLSATADKVTLLEATVDNATTGVVATAGALEVLDTAVTDSETGLTATASKVSALTVTLDGDPNAEPAVNGLSTNFNLLSNTVTDSETGLSATAGSLAGLKVVVGDATSGLVQAVNLTADESSTTAGDIDNLIASLNVANTDADGNAPTDTTLDAAIIRERQIRIDSEGSQASLIAGINVTLGKKTQTFFQDDVPTALSVGDLWIATLDDNKLYRAKIAGANEVTAEGWVPAGDETATTTTFAQNDIPTSGAVGDLWIDTDDKNTVYRAESVGANEVTTNEWVKLDLGEALASAGALETLESEVYGADGSAGASRLTAVFAELNDPAAGTSSMAQQLTDVQTEVYGDGGASASRIDSLKVSVDGKAKTFAQTSQPTATAIGDLWIDTTAGNNNKLYRASSVDPQNWVAVNDTTPTTQTFISTTVPTATTIGDLWVNSELRDPAQSDPDSDGNPNKPKNHLYRAESADANEVTAGEWVFVDLGQAVSTAEVVNFINAEVFPDGSTASSSISQISARLADANGDETGVTLEQAFLAQADVNEGLSGQYSVKVDNNGHIAGFGLSSVEVNGEVQSAFIVQANKFALVGTGTSGNGIGTTDPAAANLPFVYTTGQIADASNGNIDIPAGVYIKSAYIQNGAITTAQIGSATIDTARITGELTADHIGANTIAADSINASKLNIDGSSITSVALNGIPTLQIGDVNVNKLTGNEISAAIMSGTSVFANKLTGDVNTLIPFRSFTNQAYGGSETTMIEVDLPASSHPLGHKPFAMCTGYMEPRFERVYRFKMYMKTAVAVTTVIGSPLVSSFIYNPPNFYRYVVFSGDHGDVISTGQLLYTYMDVKSATVTNVSVVGNQTTVHYTGDILATSDSISTRSSTDYALVGETRTKSRTATRLMFSLTGSKALPDTGVVGMKVTVTQMNSQDTGFDTTTSQVTINEVSGMIMGVR